MDRAPSNPGEDDQIHLIRAEEGDPDGEEQPPPPPPLASSSNAGQLDLAIVDGVVPTFENLPTIPAAAIGICTNLIMIILVFLLPILCENEHHHGGVYRPSRLTKKDDGSEDWTDLCPLQPFSILVYSHAGHWVVHLVIDQFLKQKHKVSRLKGYIEFYLETKNKRRTPFYLISIGNAVLLITVTALNDYCDDNHCKDKFTKVDYLRGLMTLESLVIICLWAKYIIDVKEFHRQKQPPDVLRMDVLRKLRVSNGKDEVDDEETNPPIETDDLFGVQPARDDDDARKEVLEKQAELIRYLYSHIETLNKKISELIHKLAAATVGERY